MSNLHKDLPNDQIHNPKDFDTAGTDTYLSKNSSGELEWQTGSEVAGVSQIIAGSNVTVDPVGGTGAVTVNSSSSGIETSEVAIHDKCYGNNEDSNWYCMSNPNGNNEHKFTIDLGATPTTVTFANAVKGSVYTITKTDEAPFVWVGHVFGNAGLSVELKLIRFPWGDCQSGGDAPAFCEIATTGVLDLSGNTTPICFNVSEFETCSPSPVIGDIIILMAKVTNEIEGNSFSMEQTVRYK